MPCAYPASIKGTHTMPTAGFANDSLSPEARLRQRLRSVQVAQCKQAAFLCGGNPRIKKRQDRGTPTENHTQIQQRLSGKLASN